MSLSELSQKRLKGVHPDLLKVLHRAIEISDRDILVVEGMRTLSRQKKLKASGASKTLRSRHLTGHAIDLVHSPPGEALKEEHWGKPYAHDIAAAMKQAASEQDVEITWGGDWTNSWDTPHFQLAWGAYPRHSTEWRNETASTTQKAAQATAKAAKKAPFSLAVAFSTFLAWLADIAEPVLTFGMGVVAKLSEFAPLKSALIEAGANAQALTLSLITLVSTIAISKVFNPDEEIER